MTTPKLRYSLYFCFLLALLGQPRLAAAQSSDLVAGSVCTYGDDSTEGSTGPLEAPSAAVVAKLERIQRAHLVGVMPLVFAIRNFGNAGALIKNSSRYIVYDPGLLDLVDVQSGTSWASMFVLAHEYGHHAEGHTVSIGCEHSRELEADAFATRVLKRLGATEEQTTASMLALKGPAGPCHPDWSVRVAHILEVYRDAEPAPPSGGRTERREEAERAREDREIREQAREKAVCRAECDSESQMCMLEVESIEECAPAVAQQCLSGCLASGYGAAYCQASCSAGQVYGFCERRRRGQTANCADDRDMCRSDCE